VGTDAGAIVAMKGKLAKFFSTQNIYAHSPVWLQNLGITIYGISWKNRRFGGVFREELEAVRKRENFSPAEWKQYQEEKLRKLLIHSLRTVPYYGTLFSGAGLDEKTLQKLNIEGLSKIPFLEKETIRKDPLSFISSRHAKEKLYCYYTSGTTGTPVSIYFSAETHQLWSAHYESRCRNWAGVQREERRAMIGGRLVVPRGISSPPFWRNNWAEKQLYMSAFHISPSTAPLYLEALRRFSPDYLVGYASSWYFLSRFIVEQKLEPLKVKAVLTSSEKLTEEMRKTIEGAFRCEVFDAYSGVEACCLASECGKHGLHVSPDVGIIELVREDGSPAGPGETGEIVATGLLNFVQPLIRFRTGDYAVMSESACSCGSAMPLLCELVGRLEDTVIGPDGRETVRFHGLFVGLKNVREGQVIQESLDKLRLRIVSAPGFSVEDEAELERRVNERLGSVETVIEIVEGIERTERGKYRAVISRVKRTDR